ncbi:Uncharacterised protein [Vibrio cholerae]|nr:Uncharacterised protein [Vibrio cholerae]
MVIKAVFGLRCVSHCRNPFDFMFCDVNEYRKKSVIEARS